MINVITAMLNENINKKLNTFENINVLYEDVQYEEGLFEIIELEDVLDYLILNERILKESNITNNKENSIEKTLNKIIKKYKNIKIILFVDKLNEYEEKFTSIDNKMKDLIVIKTNVEEKFIIENENLFVDKIINIILQKENFENRNPELMFNSYPLEEININKNGYKKENENIFNNKNKHSKNYSVHEENTDFLPNKNDFNSKLLIEENKKMKEEIKKLQDMMKKNNKIVDKNKFSNKMEFFKNKKEINILNNNNDNKRKNNNF